MGMVVASSSTGDLYFVLNTFISILIIIVLESNLGSINVSSRFEISFKILKLKK